MMSQDHTNLVPRKGDSIVEAGSMPELSFIKQVPEAKERLVGVFEMYRDTVTSASPLKAHFELGL